MIGSHAPRGLQAFRHLLLLLALTLVGRALAAETPIPKAPTAWVTDTVGFISPGVRQALDSKLHAYEQQTGHQVVVWIGSSIGSDDLADFANKTFGAWQLGQKGKDDGLLLMVLAQDRKVDIEVGYGLEGTVPDAIASRIINDVMVPELRAGSPDAAVSKGVDAILSAIEGKPFAGSENPSPQPHRPKGPGLFGFILMGLFLLLLITNPRTALFLLFMMGGRGGGGFGGGGGGFGGGGGMSGGGGARGSW